MEKSRDELEINKSAKGQTRKSKKNSGDTIVELTVAALHTAVFCILAPHTLYLPFSPVGITLGSFLLYLTGLLLGPRLGCVSIGLYLCMGFVGLPVFSGYTAGVGVLMGPTGGFLLGYLLCVAIVGGFSGKTGRKNGIIFFISGMITGTLTLYIAGTLWFCFVYGDGAVFRDAAVACVLPFLPADIVKIVLAAVLYRPVLRLRSVWKEGSR